MNSSRSLVLTLAALAAAPALGGPGDTLWSIQRDGYGISRPAVAADGKLYWTFRGLYRLSPSDGSVVWFQENNASPLVSIGPDGTIYGTGSVNHGTPAEPFWHPTAIAISPENQVLWEWEYLPEYWYPVAGPTLGPDGNLYIISYGGYLSPGHLFSLTASGAFRWEYRHFSGGSSPSAGGLEHLTFAGSNVMKTGQYTGGPGGPLVGWGAGVIAANMQTGAPAFFEPMVSKGDPVVAPGGNAWYVGVGLSQNLRAYTAPNTPAWTHTVPWSPTGLNTWQIGPDGNLYLSEGMMHVRSVDPQGGLRWERRNILPASYYYTPSVSPDGSVVIYPTTGTGDTPGYLTALRTSDGQKLWEITLPGRDGDYGPVRCLGGIEFSPDSRTAYVPGSSWCYCGPLEYAERSHLFAIEVRAGGPAPCYANCDGSMAPPVLNVQDFGCFLSKYAAGDAYANCDGSVAPPVLNVQDFGCFLSKYAAGCP